jgi:SNF2 family DNA or RNA helicase
MFIPISTLGKAKRFDDRSLNVQDFSKYKLAQIEGDNDYVILPWTMASLRKLSLHDVFVPGPIRWEYSWPSKYPRPLDHQVVTADFLTQNPRAFVFNSIGTSKTLSALWAADYLMNRGEIRKVLITSTLSTLERVWELEIFSNLFGRTSVVLDGDKKRRLKRLEEEADFYIINHDGLKVLEKELIAKDFDLVIVDEGAVFRNQKTGMWRSCYNVCGLHTNRWLWWMTGSPMPTAPTDVWAQAKIVRPDVVPRFFGRFRSQVMFKQSQYKWIPLKGYQDIVFDTLRPAIRFTRDVCDLPPDHDKQIECEMSPEQAKAYKSMADSLVVECQQGLITALNEGVKLGKLLQIACGAVYDQNGNAVMLNPEPKFEQLDELFEFSERKIIVYSPFKFCQPMIAERYEKMGVRVGIVNGDVSVPKRNELFKQFQEGDLEMLVAHPECMAHGLTLTKSNVIVWWAPIDDYDIDDQASGRIKRPGQTKEQYIIRLACSPAEKAVYRRNRTKERTQSLVMELFGKK